MSSETCGGGRVQMQWDLRIPVRDGKDLSAILYTRADDEIPKPAVVALTPYTAQTLHDRGVFFASHGYPFLAVDARGRGNSEGDFHPRHESRDGHDVVEWVARQPFCNGKVGMWGGSYSGWAQWATAKERPTALATIVPAASPFRGVDSPFRNNVFVPYLMRWLTFLSGRTLQDKIFADKPFWTAQFKAWFQEGRAFRNLDEFLGNPSSLFQEWISHPEPDEYWDSFNPTPAEYARLSIPVLTVTGVYDADQLGALEHYRRHMASGEAGERHFLVIGPWDHAGTRAPSMEFGGLRLGPAASLDLARLHLEWYAWTMEGGAKPAFLRKRVAYFMMGSDSWRYADALDAITARSELLYLNSSGNPTALSRAGAMTSEPSSFAAPDHYLYDPGDLSLAELESTIDPESQVDQQLVQASAGKQLIYHSVPYADDAEIAGFFRLEAWISIDQPDTDIRASVYEVSSDGGSIHLTSDWLRARYREGLRKPRLIETTEPLRYCFEKFMFVARRLSRGHRLRLVIGPINSIFSQKNYNGGGVVSEESAEDARAVNVKLYHDRERPSALYVPHAAMEA
jgi:uncharacterized protein